MTTLRCMPLLLCLGACSGANTNADAERATAQPTQAVPEEAPSLESLRAATEEHPEDPEAWAALGRELLQHRHRTEAVAAFSRSLELAPAQAQLHYLIGTVTEDTEAAAAAYDRAIAIQPEHGSALYNRGELHRVAGELEAAEALFLRAAEVDNGYADGLGRVYATQHRWSDALAAYTRCMSDSTSRHSGPGAASLIGARAEALVELGRDAEALADLRRARQLYQERVQRRYARAPHSPVLRALPEDAPAVAKLELLRARVSARAGDLNAALGILRGALDLDPGLQERARNTPELEAVWALPAAEAL